MTRSATTALVTLLAIAGAGGAAAQTSSVDKPAVSDDTSGMTGDKARNAERTPREADTQDTVDVSPGVGAIEGADGKPPLPAGTGK